MTSNFARYYQSAYSDIPCSEKDERVNKVAKDGAKDFFKPGKTFRDEKFKMLLLNFFNLKTSLFGLWINRHF